MKKLTGLILAVMIAAPAICTAGGFEIEANANNTIIEGRAGIFREWVQNTVVSTGFSVIYNKDDYTLYGLDASYGTQWTPNFKLDFGFKGVAGEVENYPEDGEVGAVALMISGSYDFPAGYMFPFDMGITARLCYAPKPLNFRDTDAYTEFNTAVNIPVIPGKMGMIVAGFRHINMGFEDVANLSDLSDNAVYIGLKFRFTGF